MAGQGHSHYACRAGHSLAAEKGLRGSLQVVLEGECGDVGFTGARSGDGAQPPGRHCGLGSPDAGREGDVSMTQSLCSPLVPWGGLGTQGSGRNKQISGGLVLGCSQG